MNTWERKLENLINEILENTYTRADKTNILGAMYQLKSAILLAEEFKERKKNENKTNTRRNNNNKI